MSKATTSGMGKGGLLLRLILSILLVFSLLGTVGSAVGVSVLCGPSQLISQMHRHDAGQKVYDSLNTKFQNDYSSIGPVIGSHTGPNTMGLFFVGTER